MSLLDRLFATAYDPVTRGAFESRLAPHRAALVDGLSGTVLDLGTGTGATLPYLAALDEAVDVVAVEPNPHMRRQARERARALDADLPVRFLDAPGESLPLADNSVDAAVVSLVLCSVDDPATVIDELCRVIEPGGELRILEHVRADGWTERAQQVVEPLWRRLADGCHLTRTPTRTIVAHPALDAIELRRFDVGIPLVRPYVRGTFRRRRNR